MQVYWLSVEIGAAMSVVFSSHHRRQFLFVAMACLCVLLGGPSYAAGADSLTIAGQTYDEPGVSGTGWAWTDADHLQLNGYADEAIGAEGDLVVTLVGQNVVDEAQAEDADMCTSGLEVWGNLTLCGAGSLRATGSQCGVFALGALVIDGCLVDGRADGRGMIDASVAGVRGATVSVRGGAHVVAAGSGSGDDCHFLGMYASDGQFAVDASWVDATGAKAGVACESGSLTSALFVTPMGGAFGSSSVIDANGSVTQHVVIEPTGANPPAGETRPGTDESAGGDPAGDTKSGSEEKPKDENKPSEDLMPMPDPAPGPDEKPVPASAKTPATKTAKKTKPASTPAAALAKTGDGDWMIVSLACVTMGMLLLCLALLAAK